MIDYELASKTLTLLVSRKFEEADETPPWNWFWYDTNRRWVCHLCDGVIVPCGADISLSIRDHAFNHLKDYGLLSYL